MLPEYLCYDITSDKGVVYEHKNYEQTVIDSEGNKQPVEGVHLGLAGEDDAEDGIPQKSK